MSLFHVTLSFYYLSFQIVKTKLKADIELPCSKYSHPHITMYLKEQYIILKATVVLFILYLLL